MISLAHKLAEWIWKWLHPTKSNLYVQCNPHQNSNDVHYRDRKINSEVHLEAKQTTNGKAVLNTKSNAGIVTLDFKLYYRAIAKNTVLAKQKGRPME
jgi:hypothetical protein